MTPCKYCGRAHCVHQTPTSDPATTSTTPGRSPSTTTGRTPQTERATRARHPLFALHDLRSLRCTKCGTILPPSPAQAMHRYQHGERHVLAGEAVKSVGSLPGVVYFETR